MWHERKVNLRNKSDYVLEALECDQCVTCWTNKAKNVPIDNCGWLPVRDQFEPNKFEPNKIENNKSEPEKFENKKFEEYLTSVKKVLGLIGDTKEQCFSTLVCRELRLSVLPISPLFFSIVFYAKLRNTVKPVYISKVILKFSYFWSATFFFWC